MDGMDANDDLAIQRPYRVVAAMPVHGRLPLLEHTIKRLYQKNGCYKVVCAGDNPEEKRLCQSLGAVWVQMPNKPLGKKWNAAFLKARDFAPDAVLYVGSSDWLSENWIEKTKPYVERYGITGVPGCHFVDIPKKGEIRAVYWAGYTGDRASESIGIGRMLSAKLLELINWQPFDATKNSSMDSSMKARCAAVGYHDYFVREDTTAISISTDKWENLHSFDDHWKGKLPSQVVDANELLEQFPEAYQIFK